MNTRKNIWTIEADANDETLKWYGKAIGEMKALPIADSRSWRWQAAVHDYRRSRDPLSDPSDILPAQNLQDKYWSQCQHGSWFFIPWHRMFLSHFENIVRSFVISLGGPLDWALPYWNYHTDKTTRLLPPSFRNPQLADGSTNHLYVAERNSMANNGQDFADKADVALKCLKDDEYVSPPFGLPEFGGGATGFSHSGRQAGSLEGVPHGSMHVAVGGFMGSFNTAGLDPIFWCHHCNIDRLWEVWRDRDLTHLNPVAPAWLRGVQFDFMDANSAHISMGCEDVEDTKNSILDYDYDDISDPVPQTLGITTTKSMPNTPNLISASNSFVDIPGSAAHTHTSLSIPPASAGGSFETFGVDSEQSTIQLHIENLTSDSSARGFDLYIGIPDGEDPKEHKSKFVARIPLFGLPEASEVDGPHGGSGLSFAFDVTELMNELGLSKEVPITFHSLDGNDGASIKVGRISLYVD